MEPIPCDHPTVEKDDTRQVVYDGAGYTVEGEPRLICRECLEEIYDEDPQTDQEYEAWADAVASDEQ